MHCRGVSMTTVKFVYCKGHITDYICDVVLVGAGKIRRVSSLYFKPSGSDAELLYNIVGDFSAYEVPAEGIAERIAKAAFALDNS